MVVLNDGDALVGDMFRGHMLRSHSPTRHLFHEDCPAAEAHIAPLAQSGIKQFYVGHGGPIDAAKAQKKFATPSCP
jgi:hypothetical protein